MTVPEIIEQRRMNDELWFRRMATLMTVLSLVAVALAGTIAAGMTIAQGVM